MKTVELIPASMFVCDECGRDSFVRHIVLDEDARTDEMIALEEKANLEIIEAIGPDGKKGGLCVTCHSQYGPEHHKYCGRCNPLRGYKRSLNRREDKNRRVSMYSNADVPVCRHCGLLMKGEPYYKGGPAYLPDGDRALTNHYGGYVCSERCDIGAARDVEESPPGVGKIPGGFPNCYSHDELAEKWKGFGYD